MAASVNGVTLAALFYHHQISSNDEEGFLFGKVVKKLQDSISDSQITNYQVETTIYITDFQPWSKDFSLYGNGGKVDSDMLTTILQGKEREVIGWYGCRRNSTLRVSMKESNLHKSLISNLSPEQADHFLFLLSSSSASTNHSTLTYDHAFYKLKNRTFERVAVSVINLGDTTHTEYKSQSELSAIHGSDTLQQSFSSFCDKFESGSGEMEQVKNINELSHSLHKKLLLISNQVTESERNMCALEKEVKELSRQLEEKKQIKSREENLLDCEQPPENLTCELSASSNTDSNSEQTFEGNVSEKSNPCPMDITPNAYSIKLKELDNQVLDLDKPHSSKGYSSFDDTWLDISISTKTDPVPATNIGNKETKSVPSISVSTLKTDVKKGTGNRTRSSAKSKTTNSCATNQSESHFSFVESILDEEKKKAGSENSVTSGHGRSSRSPGVNKDTSVKQNTAQSLRQREVKRQGSAERRVTKSTAVSGTDCKLDSKTEAKIAQARTQRAKTRNAQAQSRRSLSRESKQENAPSDPSKKTKAKTDTTVKSKVIEKTDSINEPKNKEVLIEAEAPPSDVKSNGEHSEKVSVINDDEVCISSSPVF